MGLVAMGSSGVPDYRAYFCDGKGHVEQAIEFVCESDEMAIRAAEDRRNARPMELWEGARIVKKFEAQEPQ